MGDFGMHVSHFRIEWDFTTALMHFGGSFRYWWWPVAAFNKMVENDGISMPQSVDKREMQGIVERKHGEGSAKFRAFVPPAAGQNLSDAWLAMPGPGDQEKFVSRLKAELEGDSLDAYIAQLRGHADIPNVQELCSIIKAYFTVEPFNHVTPTDRIELAAFIEMLNETGKLGLDDKDATVSSQPTPML